MSDSIFVAFVRHGPTEWNAAKRIQGRTDIELSPDGRESVSAWKLPDRTKNWNRFSSPLARTRQTALLLDPAGSWQTQSSLIETHWGDYEGERIVDLRQRYGEDFIRNEERGLDFRPPGGESPRDVQRRLQTWLGQLVLNPAPQSVIAVTHKGVVRAALALATGWDMTGKPPVKLRWTHAHIFRLAPSGALEIDELNISLVQPVGREDSVVS